jgi:hypothetical protein
MQTYRFEGSCHCGNLGYVFEANAGLETLGLRACLCRFCRAHGARNTSDPSGRICVFVRGGLTRYRFGLKTADFLICPDCGTYIGAMLTDGDYGWMTVNVNTFKTPPPLDHPIVENNFDGEDISARQTRRKTRWTPVAAFELAQPSL